MIEIKGKHNTAICFALQIEETAEEQIRNICDRPEFADSKIRIMPDVHAGLGCTIGTTMTIGPGNKIVPNMVGVDIGCGMETLQIAEKEMDFARLDKAIRKNIPCGKNIRKQPHQFNNRIDFTKIRCPNADINRARLSIGTLGGGNHFIEVGQAKDGRLFLIVHSGSRHLGNQIAKYYQDKAYAALRTANEVVPRDLAYATGKLFDDYVHDMKLTQYFASLNREAMIDVIVTEMGLTKVENFTTIHNYIDTSANPMILRKGAVSARAGEKLLIPINMRDGSLICVGKGNADWNFSAPHGAGRIMSRRAAFAALSMDEYRKEMKDVFSTSISTGTLDEAPMAYKPMEEIIGQIGPTAEVLTRLKPLYNFKSAE